MLQIYVFFAERRPSRCLNYSRARTATFLSILSIQGLLHWLSSHWVESRGGLRHDGLAGHWVKPTLLGRLLLLRSNAAVALLHALLHALRLLHNWLPLWRKQRGSVVAVLLLWRRRLVLRRRARCVDLREHRSIDLWDLHLHSWHDLWVPAGRHLLHPHGWRRLRRVNGDWHLDVQVADKCAVCTEDHVDDVVAVDEPRFNRWVNCRAAHKQQKANSVQRESMGTCNRISNCPSRCRTSKAVPARKRRRRRRRR